jgi:large subunit ribosomal protein L3
MPRVRSAPSLKEAVLTGIVAYKAGMTHLGVISDTEAPSKNMEVARACTILEVPKMEVYGIRLYGIHPNTKYEYTKQELHHKATAHKAGAKNLKTDETKLEAIKAKLTEFSDASALVVAFPENTSTGQHHPMRFEVRVGGKTVEERFNLISGMLGKELKAADVFKPGEYVDLISISKGKGWQGPIKRFGVKRNAHKSTNKIRHGGPLGAFSPGKVFYTIPRAGQLGFNYRTEHNKRILKIGAAADAAQVNPIAGFKNYGMVASDYIVVDGTIPGSAKRLVRLRKSIRNKNVAGIKEPKITYISR